MRWARATDRSHLQGRAKVDCSVWAPSCGSARSGTSASPAATMRARRCPTSPTTVARTSKPRARSFSMASRTAAMTDRILELRLLADGRGRGPARRDCGRRPRSAPGGRTISRSRGACEPARSVEMACRRSATRSTGARGWGRAGHARSSRSAGRPSLVSSSSTRSATACTREPAAHEPDHERAAILRAQTRRRPGHSGPRRADPAAPVSLRPTSEPSATIPTGEATPATSIGQAIRRARDELAPIRPNQEDEHDGHQPGDEDPERGNPVSHSVMPRRIGARRRQPGRSRSPRLPAGEPRKTERERD